MKTRFENNLVATDRVERYVSELSRGLEDLGETRKREELEEIRQHLDARVQACRELGLDEEEAQEEAVRQFGSVQKVTGGLRKAYWREKFFVPDTISGATILAVVAECILVGVLGPLTEIIGTATAYYSPFSSAMPYFPLFPFTYLIFFMMKFPATFLSGVAVGWFAPRNGVRGTPMGHFVFEAYHILSKWAIISLSSPAVAQNPEIYLIPLGLTVSMIPVSVWGAYIGRRYAAKTASGA